MCQAPADRQPVFQPPIRRRRGDIDRRGAPPRLMDSRARWGGAADLSIFLRSEDGPNSTGLHLAVTSFIMPGPGDEDARHSFFFCHFGGSRFPERKLICSLPTGRRALCDKAMEGGEGPGRKRPDCRSTSPRARHGSCLSWSTVEPVFLFCLLKVLAGLHPSET